MRNRHLRLIALNLIVLLALGYVGTESRAQSDWGFFGEGWEDRLEDQEEALAAKGYCPTGACVLKLNEVQVRPSRARQGDTLTLTTIYTILTPEEVPIPVSITREIFFQGKSLGQTKDMDSGKSNGSWSQEIDFTLPADALRGVYTLRTKVSTGYDFEQKDVTFEVY